MTVGKQIARKLFKKLVAIGKEREKKIERGREKNEKERDKKK
jgi:hypothetical protein